MARIGITLVPSCTLFVMQYMFIVYSTLRCILRGMCVCNASVMRSVEMRYWKLFLFVSVPLLFDDLIFFCFCFVSFLNLIELFLETGL